MKSPERPKQPEASNRDEMIERGKREMHEGWPPKSFSPDDVRARRTEWEAESGQIIEELDWETDSDVTSIFVRANQRIEKLGDQYSHEKHQLVMEEETDRFVVDHPDKAEEYRSQWERWAKVAGVDPNISEAEWRHLARMNPSVSYMGQYRSIARAVYRQL